MVSSCIEILYSSSNEWTRVTNINLDVSGKHTLKKKTIAENKENDNTEILKQYYV